MKKYDCLFDWTLGNFDCKSTNIPMKHNQDTPYHAPCAFLVPHLHQNTFKKELNFLVLIIFLNQNTNS